MLVLKFQKKLKISKANAIQRIVIFFFCCFCLVGGGIFLFGIFLPHNISVNVHEEIPLLPGKYIPVKAEKMYGGALVSRDIFTKIISNIGKEVSIYTDNNSVIYMVNDVSEVPCCYSEPLRYYNNVIVSISFHINSTKWIIVREIKTEMYGVLTNALLVFVIILLFCFLVFFSQRRTVYDSMTNKEITYRVWL